MSNFNPKIVTGGVKRNKFDLSYYSRLTTRMGELVPVLCKKIVPSDEFRVNINAITRLAPLANPVYDRLRIDYDAFFVQNRIIDPNFKEFLTGGLGLNGQESTEGMLNIRLLLSQTSSAPSNLQIGAGTLFDFLGLRSLNVHPVGVQPFSIALNAEPFLGYLKIHEDWYRNERFDAPFYSDIMKLMNPARVISFTNDSPSNYALFHSYFDLKRRNYDKDPYTTALSEPLIGGPVPILSGSAPLYSSDNVAGPRTDLSYVPQLVNDGNYHNPLRLKTVDGLNVPVFADLSSVVSNTVQQLNQMYALYRFFMTDTYNGNRYVEFVQSHFGVRVPDSTLERPMFLGRLSSYVNFSEIFQTSGSTDQENTLGDYAGKGAGITSGFLFQEKFLEHGYLYVIMSIVPESTYFQGIDEKLFYGDRFESFYFPEFQNIGDDVVSLYDIYASPSFASGFNGLLSHSERRSKVFGYNRRNYNLIYYPNEVHGDFSVSDNMLNWTFARKFASSPTLGSKFCEVPSINNPFTYTDQDSQNFFTDILFDIKALRPVERYESITTH